MSSSVITIGVIVVLILLIVLMIWVAIPMWSLRKNKKKAEALKAFGKAGEATILRFEDTGIKEKNNPKVKVLLEIHIPGYPPYQVEKMIVIPAVRASQLQVGSSVAVLADPNQPTIPDKVGIFLK